MDFGLKGKVALVAASSRGLGRAIAEALAGEGADLILCARGEEALVKTGDHIAAASGVRVVALPVDLTQPADVTRFVAEGTGKLGGIDILVTNTGGPPAGRFETLSRDAWELAVRQNLDSVLNLTREVLPGMKEKQWGRIVNITSISVKQPVDNLMLSNSIRAAVTGFARTLANEVAADGITVNNVLPGYTRTDRLVDLSRRAADDKNITMEKVQSDWAEQVPMKRLGEPPELAALVAFLVSERASYITGTSIPVDGGWIRGLF